MRFPVEVTGRSRSSARFALILTVTLPLALGGCLSAGGEATIATAGTALALVGPEADYPVVLGESYSVAGVSYKPEDVMNYDEVGYLTGDHTGGSAISAAHHTLPLPSYVEVTSLDTGRTILVRVERRGPMDGNQLLALSPGAMSQLDAKGGTPVRVRRVNTPEEQRAMLRAGQSAPLRMDTPMSLVAVLKRKLPGNVAASAPVAPPLAVAAVMLPSAATTAPASAASRPSAVPAAPAAEPPVVAPSQVPAAILAVSAPVVAAASAPTSAVAAPRASKPAPARAASAVTPDKGFVVQAAAFSTAENAQKAARTLGGAVTKSGAFWRVRTGPFATRSAAEASLAKVKAAGYSDARIFTNG